MASHERMDVAAGWLARKRTHVCEWRLGMAQFFSTHIQIAPAGLRVVVRAVFVDES